MSQYRPREPARGDLNSDSPSLTRVSGVVGRWLSRFFPHLEDAFRVGECSNGEFEGHYLLRCGGGKFFVKVIAKEYLTQQLISDHFARFVAAGGVRANPIIDGGMWEVDGVHILSHKWVDGCFLSDSYHDLALFGEALGRLHNVLATYKDDEQVKSRTAKRYDHLNQVLGILLDEGKGVGPYPEQSLSLLRRQPYAFENILGRNGQVLHGDLNVGNIMVDREGVIFLDFEDSIHSWLPRLVEVAFAVERLALVNTVNDDQAYNNAVRILDGYYQTHASKLFTVKGSFLDALRWLSIRSLCMLYDYEQKGCTWSKKEWGKFDKLINHMNRRESLINRIENKYL